MATNELPAESLDWNVDVALLTNRHVLGGLATAMLGGAFVSTLLVGLLLGVQGDWDVIPPLAGMLLAIGVALFVVGLLVMAVFFRNRMQMQFTVGPAGIGISTIDPVARTGNRAAMLMGLAFGSGAAAGSGLLAMVNEKQTLRWTGAFRATFEPSTRSIALRNGWRTLIRIYCLPANYEAAAALVQRYMQQHGTAQRVSAKSPVGRYLLRTALVVLASLPVFAVSETYGIGLLLPLILLCFGLATVWFVRPMAWVALTMLATIVVRALRGAFAERHSYLNGEAYRRFETLAGDDWALTVLALIGMTYLAWLSIATLREKVVPALAADLVDAGDESA